MFFFRRPKQIERRVGVLKEVSRTEAVVETETERISFPLAFVTKIEAKQNEVNIHLNDNARNVLKIKPITKDRSAVKNRNHKAVWINPLLFPPDKPKRVPTGENTEVCTFRRGLCLSLICRCRENGRTPENLLRKHMCKNIHLLF
ncbi:hypothetical protein [Bacillus sp. MUM 13]|uniref:hypothetical protein n=1 Tax=Bacillus sp. MUM 13 TaxID=1678001 RepID=UPI0008F5C1DB|nr:hypothetical protein [Bacillus sp. MUM 13]OIK11113.1 hypothetical protein BIV59_13170 [Bacillus sp. MUM 13]